jgi:hypothetical protein
VNEPQNYLVEHHQGKKNCLHTLHSPARQHALPHGAKPHPPPATRPRPPPLCPSAGREVTKNKPLHLPFPCVHKPTSHHVGTHMRALLLACVLHCALASVALAAGDAAAAAGTTSASSPTTAPPLTPDDAHLVIERFNRVRNKLRANLTKLHLRGDDGTPVDDGHAVPEATSWHPKRFNHDPPQQAPQKPRRGPGRRAAGLHRLKSAESTSGFQQPSSQSTEVKRWFPKFAFQTQLVPLQHGPGLDDVARAVHAQYSQGGDRIPAVSLKVESSWPIA